MRFPRCGGILLHPTSLPGPHGIGDLGEQAHRWVDTLAEAKQRVWQVLPLGPTGYGDSPYQSFSAFAGNPLLVDLVDLQRRGWLPEEALVPDPPFPAKRVDYGRVITFKWERFRLAFRRFKEVGREEDWAEFRAFRREEAHWLDDFTLFMALKDRFRAPWNAWPRDIRLREPDALARYRSLLAEPMEEHAFVQWQFFRQWKRLRDHVRERGIYLIGDIPIFVAYDSADVWAHPELFHLDEEGRPTVVAGVPPDYFSPTGQLWGNPLYRWDVLAREGYRWWIDRFRTVLRLVDWVRLDHFRGFEAYWEIPAGMPTAEVGRWVKGPGDDFFRVLTEALGDLPIIAEDLGIITPDVEALRDRWGFPGMKVLQFAFSGPDNPYLPHNYSSTHWVVYTGTHDNDTTRGWYASLDEGTRSFLHTYLGGHVEDVVGELIRLAWQSVARVAVVPLQDVFRLGSEARMNFPGRPDGNWAWRFRWAQWTSAHTRDLSTLAHTYRR